MITARPRRKTWRSPIAISLTAVCVIALLSVAWLDPPRSLDARTASAHTFVDRELVSANTRFGFKLWSEIVRHDADQNILISPASVALALAVLYNGAAGETQQALAAALELQGLSLDEVNRANDMLRLTLENPDPEIQLDVANSLWASEAVPFKTEFMRRTRDFYGAQVVNLDLADPDTPSRINAWASRHTRGKIGEIVQEIDPDTILILINAIYFKGAWSRPFDVADTRDGVFILPDGEPTTVPMMYSSRTDEFQYYRGEKFQAVRLAYGSNVDRPALTPFSPPHIQGRVSMYIFLPDADSSLDEFYAHLSAEAWEGWMRQFTPGQAVLSVALPRFKYDYEVTLDPALQALGMQSAFDPAHANFEAMTSMTGVYVDEVKHKTYVEVNEDGTEAVGMTSWVMLMSGSPPFVINRPFFFVIRDNVTGTILFMGSVVDPRSGDG